MERYYAATASSGDQTTSSDSVSWLDTPSLRQRRMLSPSPNAFLTPAFNACAATASPQANSCPTAASILDLDPSLLRFTRNRLHLSSTSSSSSGAAARKKLHRLLQLSSLSSGPPPAAIENAHIVAKSSPQVYKTPVKVEVEEDVLVMDGVLVSESGSNRSKSVSDSGSTGSGNSLYKTEICRSWEESGICRYGSKCQFAHGKEELRGARPIKQKTEMDRQNSRSVQSAGSAVQATRFCHPPPPGLSNAAATAAPLPPTVSANQTVATSASASAPKAATAAVKEDSPSPTPTTAQKSQEPSFVWPPTQEEDAYFTQVLYGPRRRKRLPVFTEICPE